MRKSSPSIPLPPLPAAPSSPGFKAPSYPTAPPPSRPTLASPSNKSTRPRQSPQPMSPRTPISCNTSRLITLPIGGTSPSTKKPSRPLSPKSVASPRKTRSPRPGSRDTIIAQRRTEYLTKMAAPIQECNASSDSDSASVYSFKSCSSTDTIVPPTGRRGSPDSRSQIASGSESMSSTDSFARRVHDFPLPPTFTPETPERGSPRFSREHSRSPNGRHPSSPHSSPAQSAASSPAASLRSPSSRRPPSILDYNRGSSGWDDEDEDRDSGSEDEDAYMSMSEDDYEDAVSMMSGMYYSARTSLEF